jgi:glycosyltransferase involved in cell wall biosynthesis
MKVTLVGPVYPYRGGIAHYTTLLAQALQGKSSLQVISFRRQYPAWLYPGQTDRDPSRAPLQVRADFPLDPIFPWTWRRAAQQIVHFRPDIAVLPWWTPFWAPALASLAWLLRKNQIPVLFLVHNVLPHQEKQRLLALLPKTVVEVFPHPVYDIFAGQSIPQSEARRQLGLPETRPVVLSFGIVRPYKGLKHLIEAVAILRDQGLSVGLLVAGEFWEAKAPYSRQIDRLGLGGQVSLIDRYILNEELPLIFSAADIFAAPYTGGTQSGSLKLALGFGLPLVASRNVVDEEMRAMQEQGVFIVAPGDAQELAAAIRRGLACHPSQAGQTGGKLAPRSTSWDDLAAVIEKAAARFY